jgi:formylglycine-generating enzyme required for sulfatase activity
VDLLARDPGQDRELWARQLLALRVLERVAPGELARLVSRLREHPSSAIRDLVAPAPLAQVLVAAPAGYAMVLVPGGTFVMGSTERGEKPAREVALAAFYLGRHPVTNEEYARFLQAKPGQEEPQFWGDRRFNQPRQPVVGVSWHDAVAFCEWAGLTLPTEAQWEYACRAGTRTRYSSGDKEEDLARVGWYAGNSGGHLHAVGEKPANEFGLHDMHGNVWEWCEDGYGSYAVDPRPGDGLREQPGASGRVLRGGSFRGGAAGARSAYRLGDPPGVRWVIVGFRPARAVTTE